MNESIGVYLPNRVAKRIATGRPTVVLAADDTTYSPDITYLLADDARIIGTARLVPAHTVVPSGVDKDAGLKAGQAAKMWPTCSKLHTWKVADYKPLCNAVPLVRAGDVRYGATFDLPAGVEVAPIDKATADAMGEARALAGALLDLEARDPLVDQVLGGPYTMALARSVGPLASAVLSCTAGLAHGVGKADCGSHEATCAALDAALSKGLPGLPEEAQEALRLEADLVAQLVHTLPLVIKRSYPVLVVPDPKWTLQKLAAGQDAGVLLAKPMAGRAGVDHVLVNEVQQKADDEDYAVPVVWAVVRMGEGQLVGRPAMLDKPTDPASLEEWRGRKEAQAYFHRVVPVRVMDIPVQLRTAAPGQRSLDTVDLVADAACKAAWPDVIAIRDMGNDQLDALVQRLVRVWASTYQGSDQVQGREDLINSLIFLLGDLDRRGRKRPSLPGALAQEVAALGKVDKQLPEDTDCGLEAVSLAQVVEHMGKPITLRRGAVTLVGNVCNHGTTGNDVDVLLQGPMGDGLRDAIELRMARMFPVHIGKRLSFMHDAELGGPFTNHMELYDLALVPSDRRQLVEMRDLGKADDPHLDLPAKRGPVPAVFQWHFRGKSLHGDLRIKVGSDYLVGWTMMLQQAGITAPEDLAQARSMAREFDPGGGKYNKDFLAPAGVQATGKDRQPVEWLHMEGEAIEPGEAGATSNLPGYMVEVPGAPEFAEFGVQKPYFHEYFLTGGSKMIGRLIFRQLSGSHAGAEPFWRAFLSKDYLPSILDRRSVKTRTMPPDGYSWIPTSMEKQVPAVFRYWEKKGEEARKVRDALVDDGYFTASNVRLVNGKFARVEEQRKVMLTLLPGTMPGDVLKDAARATWVLVYQAWKGQHVAGTGPSREVWRLGIDVGGKRVQFEAQADPMAAQRVTATMRKLQGVGLWDLSGDVEPGKRYDGDVFNDTKATPATSTKLDAGTATVLEEGDGMMRLRMRGEQLRGVYMLAAEEPGGDIWTLERSEGATIKVDESACSPGGDGDTLDTATQKRTVLAMVYDTHLEKGSQGVFTLVCAVGPVDPRDWQNVVEIDGLAYTVIGKVEAATAPAPGATVAVDVMGLLYSQAGGKQGLRWDGARACEELAGGQPMGTAQVVDLLEASEYKNYMDGVVGSMRLVGKADGDDDTCYVFGEVLVPNMGTGEPKDTQGDVYSKEDVQRACFTFMRNGHKHGLMHKDFINGKVVLLENYLMPVDVTLTDMAGQDRWIPQGTWMQRLQVLDSDLKSQVRAGKLTGFSVGGTGTRQEAGA